MAEKFLMPKLSPTMEEGQISRWMKNEGDTFEANETLAEVDTDKATMEMTALKGGTLLKIIKGAGETAALGETIAITGNAGDDFSALLSEVQSSKSNAPSQNGASQPQVEESKPVEETKTVEAETPKEVETPTSDGRLLISPIAARMAAEHGIDLHTLKGSGPQGRIIKRDIETAIESGVKSQESRVESREPQAEEVVQTERPQTSDSRNQSYTDEPMTKMRETIAKRLAASIGPIPTFYLTVEIEMDKALDFRKQLNAALPEEQKVSVNDLIVKVVANSLVKHPNVNSSFQEKAIRRFRDADVGVAVAIEDGLITPVVRGANRKGIAEIGAEIRELAARAKARKLQPEEYTGASFSVSNLGMFGIEHFTAIINPPESGILAVGASMAKPVVRDGEIVVRQIMNVTMSCDHRVVDGATGAKFLQTFKQLLENPLLLLA